MNLPGSSFTVIAYHSKKYKIKKIKILVYSSPVQSSPVISGSEISDNSCIKWLYSLSPLRSLITA